MLNNQKDAHPWLMIRESIRRLIRPSDSLIIAAHQADREHLQHEISVLEAEIYVTNAEVLSAVTLLMALEEVRSTAPVPSYLDLIENEQMKDKKRGKKTMNVTDFPLKPEQLLRCQQVVSKYTTAAQNTPLLKVYSSIELIALVTIVVFEAALFFHIFAYINEDGNGAISGNMLGLTGLIALLTFHIVATEDEDSAPVRITRRIVFTMLPFFTLGAGVLFASSLINGGLESLFESSNLEAESSLMAGWLQNYILPNAIIIIVIGMSGFTAFCVFSASKLLQDLKENIQKINTLEGKKKVVEQCMKIIIKGQTKHAVQCTELKQQKNNLNNLPENTAQKLAIMGSKALGILDSWIMGQELSPLSDRSDKSPLDVLFDFDDAIAKAIKTLPLNILKQKRDELKALDQSAIVSILH